MKRIISLILVTVLIATTLCGCSGVDDLRNTLNLNSYSDSVRYKIENGEATVTGVENKTTVTEIIIPDEYDGYPVTAIKDFAIVNLEYVTKITIGKNVKEIGEWALTNNQYVTEIKVSEENEYFCDVDGVLFSKDMTTLVFYPIMREAVITRDSKGAITSRSLEYTVPESVDTIGGKAFYKCYNLTGIILHEGIKTIGEKAFFHCDLKELILPEGLEYIGKDAFGYNYNITELRIGSGIKEIGEYAFYNCTSLLKINVDAKESDLSLGKKWYPTNNGITIDELEVLWNG